jgi:hypothetical protein
MARVPQGVTAPRRRPLLTRAGEPIVGCFVARMDEQGRLGTVAFVSAVLAPYLRGQPGVIVIGPDEAAIELRESSEHRQRFDAWRQAWG